MFANRFSLLWPSATLEFGGGGGSKAPKPPKQQPIKFPKMPEIRMPEMPAPQEMPAQIAAPPPPPPAPPPPPPPTATSAEAAQADQQLRADNAKRKGLRKTILAGETGQKKGLGGKTVLGGATQQI